MKRSLSLFLSGLTVLLASCGSIETLTIDYLIPADLSFPPQIRYVGVVNNVNVNVPDSFAVQSNDSVLMPWELARQVDYYNGDAKLTTESLAESIADANYFDEVVISDSVLRANDTVVRETTLSRDEINQLADELDVDMIIALENIQMKAVRSVSILPEHGFLGAVDLKIFPNVKLYIPSRSVPLASITPSDSIYWDDIFYTQMRAQTQVIAEDKMIQEGSTFAGTVPVKHMLPYWKNAERVYYASGKSLMRDAAVMVKNDDWDGAYNLWQQVHQSDRDKDKMQSAFNIALYHEMNDNMDEAIKWATEAFELARSINGFKEPIPDIDAKIRAGYGNENFILSWQYLSVLKERQQLQAKLNMQMQRFEYEN